MEDFAVIIDLLREFGLWIVFAWLYSTERKAHNETRHAYFEDLRDLAGVKPSLRPREQNLPDIED